MLGFVGIEGSKIEMLFVTDKAREKGIGKQLLQYAIEQLGSNKVDVNEQNPLAVGFLRVYAVQSRFPLTI